MSKAGPELDAHALSVTERVVLVATVVLCRLVALRACSIYDDAFITFRYALNFAAGRGLVFNPGEPWEPVLGTTTPAFAVLLAGFAKLGIGPVTAALSINILSDALSAALIASLCGARRRVAVLAVLAFACLPQAVRIALGGMESSLFVLCGLAACRRMFAGKPFVAGALAAGACVVRPEGVLLVLALAFERRRNLRELARFFVPIVVVGVATVSTLLAAYGDVIPQSVRAKSTMHSEHRASLALELCARILSQSFLPHWSLLAFLPFVMVGLVVALRRSTALRAFSLFALAITASYLLARPHLWGWYFHVQLVAWTMWLALGIDAVLEQTAAGRAIASWRPIAWAERRDNVAAPALVFACVACVSALRPSPVPRRVYEPMQAWARETSAREPGARILAADIGAIGYAWNGTVLDSEGLTWPAAVAYKFSNRMIAETRPEYLLIVVEYARLAHFYLRPDLFGLYEPIRRFSVDGETDLSPALQDVPRDWRQDYIVYRRKQP